MSQATMSIGIDKLEELIELILESIEPNVPHKRNPFEYCEEAHRVKEKLCDEMLKLLPCDLVEKVKRANPRYTRP